MNYLTIIAIFALLLSSVSALNGQRKAKTIFIVMLARNKEHTLPYFLSHFESLTYPKNRISLYIRSDHNSDNTNKILNEWLNQHRSMYHSVDANFEESNPEYYIGEGSPTNWTSDRFEHIINIKEDALQKARNLWADYLLFLDLDVYLFEKDVLQNLIAEDKPIISPMLDSLGTYSNFWGEMTENYWYTRSEDYIPILERKQQGCFNVPMVHSFVLIDMSLQQSDKLSFLIKNIPPKHTKNLPKDDIIDFAISSKLNAMNMFVCNTKRFGFIPPPLDETDNLSKDHLMLTYLKLEAIVFIDEFFITNALKKYETPLPEKNTLGFDHVYMINLARRPDRRAKMLKSFDLLGIDSETVNAVDGKRLNASYLDSLGIKQLDLYKDPWAKRDMTYGEIGCFLSHYHIWEDIVENEYMKVLIFEDDIRFQPYFKSHLEYLTNQMQQLSLSWDLVYLGRKKLKSSEDLVEGSDVLVHAEYSYWTLCYMITYQGAKKLLRPDPLSKILPVDEYLPIMFDRHPEESWKMAYEPRSLNAFSAHPLLVFPTHYTGDEGYVSDTERSPLIVEDSTTVPDGPTPPVDAKLQIKPLFKQEL